MVLNSGTFFQRKVLLGQITGNIVYLLAGDF